ncbi:MAG TPA: gluconate 2-dehydrogenase subunit 3 family protein [Candidatus Sulfotelmatobacter sp.]|nr:gluconate 2-dehydrogenase subunit 3 family protein [Candidatus Sulfotelmatobacter sp.]
MRRRLSRRRFLQGGLAASLAIGSGAMVCSSAAPAVTPKTDSSARNDSDKHALLRAVIDEIIPAGNGMPAASDAGVLTYLERLADQNPDFGKRLDQSLVSIEDLSQSRFHKKFLRVAVRQRMPILQKMEKLHPDSFSFLRDYTYEGYYTQPKIWSLMGYQFKPTNGGAPHMKPFDESVLAQVRTRPKYYREVL